MTTPSEFLIHGLSSFDFKGTPREALSRAGQDIYLNPREIDTHLQRIEREGWTTIVYGFYSVSIISKTMFDKPGA